MTASRHTRFSIKIIFVFFTNCVMNSVKSDRTPSCTSCDRFFYGVENLNLLASMVMVLPALVTQTMLWGVRCEIVVPLCLISICMQVDMILQYPISVSMRVDEWTQSLQRTRIFLSKTTLVLFHGATIYALVLTPIQENDRILWVGTNDDVVWEWKWVAIVTRVLALFFPLCYSWEEKYTESDLKKEQDIEQPLLSV